MMHATTADEWFDHFIREIESNAHRRRRAISELYRPLPPRVLKARVYDAHTEKLRAALKDAAHN